jgi:type II secretory pathway component PulF
MNLFTYKAIDDLGNEVTGEITAESEEHAMEMIAQTGQIPESLKKKTVSPGKFWKTSALDKLISPVTSKDIALFTMQFKTLLQSGISIIQIFQILEEQTENQKLCNVCTEIIKDLREGTSLFNAFSRHDTIFSNLYCTLIKTGELSGALPDILERLVFILEHEEKVKSDIKSAIRYPLIVIFFLTIAFFVLLTLVVPKFVTLFQGAGIELPLPTKICIFLYLFLNHYWHYILGFAIAASIGLFLFIKTEKGKYTRDSLLMKIPFVGKLLVKSAMSRFASIFSILQSSGISVLESLKILADTLNNKAIANEFDKVKELLVEGRGIAAPLGKARYFPPMVVNMIAIGEQSGTLDDTLVEISKHYDVEVEYATKAFSEALGPALVVVLAAVVCFFAFAIFLPMWDLTKIVK